MSQLKLFSETRYSTKKSKASNVYYKLSIHKSLINLYSSTDSLLPRDSKKGYFLFIRHWTYLGKWFTLRDLQKKMNIKPKNRIITLERVFRLCILEYLRG